MNKIFLLFKNSLYILFNVTSDIFIDFIISLFFNPKSNDSDIKNNNPPHIE